MSFASVASQLYTIKSRKNVNFSTAFGMMVREEIAARTSVFNLVRIATGSTLLATILHAKYGKKTPLEREEEKQAKKQTELDKRFKMFTASSIANLSKRISLAEEITKRNTAMILNLYNDLGHSRFRRRINPANIRNLSSVRIPIASRTVVGEIDQLKKQIEELEKLKKVRPKLQTKTEKKKKEKKEEVKSDSASLLSGLLANPETLKFLATRLIPMVGAGVVTALGFVSGAPSRTIDRLMGRKPTWINPETNKEEPMPDWLEEATGKVDPYITGATAATAAIAGYGVFKAGKALYRGGKVAAGAIGGAYRNIRNRYRAPTISTPPPAMPTATPTAATPNPRAGIVSQFAGLSKRQLTTGATGDRIASMLNVSKKQLSRMSVREIKAALRAAAPAVSVASGATAAAASAAPTPPPPMISSDNLNRVKVATEQSLAFQRFSKIILKTAKFLAPIKIGIVTLEISKMASAIADYGDGKISYSEYKEIMSMGYAQIVDTVGIIAVSTAAGAAGGAIATTYGLGLGAIPGAVIGLGAGIAVDMVVDEDNLLPIGTYIFETIHEDKSPPTRQITQKTAVGAEGGVDLNVPTQQPMGGGVGASWNTSMPSYAGGLEVGLIPSVPRIEGDEGVQVILKTIRTKESGNNYKADTSKDPRWIERAKKEGVKTTASGAYQFIDSTWRGLTNKYGIGQVYTRAVYAPPQVQDQVAAAYVSEILAATGGDVSKVPVAWYTGNIQGKLSETAKRLNYGMSVASYQRAWLKVYSGITGTRIDYKPTTASVVSTPVSGGDVPIAVNQSTSSVSAPPTAETESSSEMADDMETRLRDAQITAQGAALATQQLATASATLQAGINETRAMIMDNEFPSVLNPQHKSFRRYDQIVRGLDWT